jgi:hypothetical protein
MVRLVPAGVAAGPARMTIAVNRAPRTTLNPYKYGKSRKEIRRALEYLFSRN